MQNRTKIGILTFYDTINYGAALQAYALQQALISLGADPEFLSYVRRRSNTLPNNSNKLSSLFKGNFKGRINMLIHLKRTLKIKKCFKDNTIGFKGFQEEYLHCSREQYYKNEDFKYANCTYDGFITGSDMVWTPLTQNLYPYFLQFADRQKRYSYAPSLTGCERFSEETIQTIKKYLMGFDLISCREQEGVDFVKSITGKDAVLNVDPTLLFNKSQWRNLLNIPFNKNTKKYILCYTFGGLSKSLRKEVYRIARENNLDVRYVPMTQEEMYSELKKGNRGPFGPKEFVELFFNASFVVTNTFHGFLFSLISELPFVVIRREIGNAWKANETRISNLMELIGITDRYIECDSKIDNSFLNINYNSINSIIEKQRQDSFSYLNTVVDAISKNKFNHSGIVMTNIRELSSNRCTGCNLCSLICPFNAIRMKEDNEGFLKPYVDDSLCKECGKCAKMCPSIHDTEKQYPIDSKLCLSKDTAIENCASGGFFYTIAKYYIEHLNGFVYGVVFDKNYNCLHIEASSLKELEPMQNSKYIQSYVGTCYVQVKKRLQEGRHVLFSGTPCQIAALKSYLNRDYNNLLLIDIVCHGVPSPGFWKSYINEYQKKDIINYYMFRNRANKRTWNPGSNHLRRGTQESTISVSSGVKHIPAQNDPYYGPFVRCESYRLSCYYCKYASNERVGDITIGDCDSEKKYPSFYPFESKSIVLINNQKSLDIWNKISDLFYFTQLDYREEVKANLTLGRAPKMPLARDYIYKDLSSLSWSSFSKKYSSRPNKYIKCIYFMANKIVKSFFHN